MSHAPRHPKSTHRAQAGDAERSRYAFRCKSNRLCESAMSQRCRCIDFRAPDSSRSRGMAIADFPPLRAPAMSRIAL
jgi:hypothetical protein